MPEPTHPYGWLSLLPPVVAILLAIVTRRVILSLVAGLFAGTLLMHHGNVFAATYDLLERQLWSTLIDEGKLRVFSFTLLMGAMVGVINRGGGMRGLINIVARLAKTRRGAQLSTWFLGLLIFFDDYANTMLLGNTLRPLCDRMKISREKLAYLVDSTAAPVAGVALVSTWIAVELDYIRDGLANLDTVVQWNPFELFVASIKYRFYVLLSLVFVPLVAIFGRDFGPMLKAERRCLAGNVGDTAGDSTYKDPNEPPEETPTRWYNAVIPILVTLGVVLALIIQTGKASFLAKFPDVQPTMRDIFGAADSSFALQYGALAGLILAAALAGLQRILTSDQILTAAGNGAKIVLPAIMILWCASTLSRMTGNKSWEGQPSATAYQFKEHRLYTAEWLESQLVRSTEDESGGISYPMLPTVVFVLASVVAFCTGTSFGTMGILVPMVVSLAYGMLSASGQTVTPDNPILLSSIGGVLAGAVFGDHCSPISDTTVLSSQASGCNHIAHVWTQMPYALTVGTVSILLGTLPIGYGFSVWVLLPLQVIALLAILLTLGRVTDETPSSTS